MDIFPLNIHINLCETSKSDIFKTIQSGHAEDLDSHSLSTLLQHQSSVFPTITIKTILLTILVTRCKI